MNRLGSEFGSGYTSAVPPLSKLTSGTVVSARSGAFVGSLALFLFPPFQINLVMAGEVITVGDWSQCRELA